MQNVSWFKDLTKNDLDLAGGKALNLGIMYNAGLPVPPGFVVTAYAFKRFIEDNKLAERIYAILDNLDVENSAALQLAAKEVQDFILSAEMPNDIKNEIIEAYDSLNIDYDTFKNASKAALEILKSGRDLPYVAVRSSATLEDAPGASFAGQQETFLNIRGVNNLLKSVQKCWASLYTARAIYYRVKNNFAHEKVYIAVVVQKQIQSNKSGVVFTINPATNIEEEIVIETGFGLGEAVVSGAITPDQYILDKNNLRLKEKTINKQDWLLTLDVNLGYTVKRNIPEGQKREQKLNDFEIRRLGELAVKIEDYYGSPQDIEYAIEGPNIYIVQSRPVTTLKKVSNVRQAEEKFTTEPVLKGLGASPGIGNGSVRLVFGVDDLPKIQKGDVLVASQTNPDYVVAMKKAIAIVTDEGGITSHASIVSRELGIACVVGAINATKLLKNGDFVTVDGYSGKVYKGEVAIKPPEIEKEKYEKFGNVETITEIKVNIDMPDYAEKAASTDNDGIGLLRLEMMIASNNVHPMKYIREGRDNEYISMLVDNIGKIASFFKNKPIWVRTSDFRTDEYVDLEGGEEEPKESNPMIGWHGIRRSLDDISLLKAEFSAIKLLHDQGHTNIGVMLPFVINVEEIKKAKEIMQEIGLDPCENIDFGVMIETPAACQIIREICDEGIDFVSFGTNDLTQLTLGIDRNNRHIAKLFNEKHPAVLRLIKEVIKTCKEYNVETSICGQAGSDEEMVEYLVKIGIDSVSANIDAVDKIRHVVARTERKLLLGVARKDYI
ncbi:phosphoenolpyruvate synthase [Candidatus Woesearchaeota archaeon]|nr:phosphoenolpyruvate synthase [Candidatus Woesearchaeota archaeon]